MNNKILREVVIICLLILVTIFTLGILFYDYIPTSKTEIVSVEYETDDNVENVLNEIKVNSGVDIKSNKVDVPLKSYTITREDLDIYESEKSYESGKKDPFSENAEPVDGKIEREKINVNTEKLNSGNPVFIDLKEEIKKTENAKTENTKTENAKTENTKVENAKTKSTKVESSKTELKMPEITKSGNTTTGTFFEKENSK